MGYNTLKNLIFLGGLLWVSGCTSFHYGDVHDKSLNLKRSDFLELSTPLYPNESIEIGAVNEPQKDLGPLISVDITEKSPLRNVLTKLAEDAKTPIVLGFKGNPRIIYRADKRPFRDILQEICDLASLKIIFHSTHVEVQDDIPYIATYSLPFLTLIRSNQNVTSLSTGILNAQESQGNLGNSSTTSLKGETKMTFWEDMESNLNDLLKKMTLDEVPLFQKPKGLAYQEMGKEIFENPQVEKKSKTIPYYSLNKQAGFLMFYGTSQHHKVMQIFLNKIKNSLSTQILIEAKVIEVALKDEYKSGINWRNIFGKTISFNAALGNAVHGGNLLGNGLGTDDIMSFAIKGKDMAAILQLMETFGTVRTLSSPRLTVMNNQSAFLKVAENQVFFQIQYDRQSTFHRNEDVSHITASSKIQTIPVGFILVVHPAIDVDTKDIILNLRPTITRITGMKEDPAIKLMARQMKIETHDAIKSEIPIVAVREIDSVLRMKSGEVVVLGGLMQEGASNLVAGIPGTEDTPFSFFTHGHRHEESVVELVIFLRATILNTSQIHPNDQRLCQKYTKDPRPIIQQKG